MSVLVCENLTKIYKNSPSVYNFNFNFFDNQIYTIVGKKDSGIDTLLNLISTRTKSDEGCVYLDGEELYNNYKMNKRICFISKETTFPGHLSVKSIFKIMASYYTKWDNGYAYELINYFQIKHNMTYRRLPLHHKKLLLGILGIACRTNITIFNSTLDDVDLKDRYDLFNFIYAHHIRYPRTLIIATEFVDEIENIAQKVLFFDKGHLFESFTIDYIKNNFRYLSGKTEVLKSLISGVKVIGIEERDNNLTVCVGKKLTKDETRKYQKYLIKISEVPIEKIFIYLLNLRDKKGI